MAKLQSSERPTVFLIEDNPDDLFFFRKGVSSASLSWDVVEFTTGAAFEESLEAPGRKSVELMFVDLKLPKHSGIDVIKSFRADPQFERTPIIVLSGSASESDVKLAIEAGCNSYFVKPDSLKGYVSLLKSIDRYWFQSCLIYPRTPTSSGA